MADRYSNLLPSGCRAVASAGPTSVRLQIGKRAAATGRPLGDLWRSPRLQIGCRPSAAQIPPPPPEIVLHRKELTEAVILSEDQCTLKVHFISSITKM